MEIRCSQPSLKWQKQLQLAETALTHEPISRLVVANNNVAYVPKETWDIGPNICQMSTFDVASSLFAPSWKWQMATDPTLGNPWFSHPKESIQGDILYLRRDYGPFPNHP